MKTIAQRDAATVTPYDKDIVNAKRIMYPDRATRRADISRLDAIREGYLARAAEVADLVTAAERAVSRMPHAPTCQRVRWPTDLMCDCSLRELRAALKRAHGVR